jgi:hypothetical protein
MSQNTKIIWLLGSKRAQMILLIVGWVGMLVAGTARAQMTDAKEWLRMSKRERLYYLQDFLDGVNAVMLSNLNDYEKCLAEKKSDCRALSDHVARVIERVDLRSEDERIETMMTALYRDPANANVKKFEMVWRVLRALNRKTSSEILGGFETVPEPKKP